MQLTDIIAKILLVIALVSSAFAIAPSSENSYIDYVARAEIIHLKEVIQENDHRYEQLRASDALRNEQRFIASEKAVEAALAAVKDAGTKTEVSAEKRFDSVNEFRNQLKDQAATFVTRTELWGSVFAVLGLLMTAFSLLQRRLFHRDSGEEQQG